MNSDINDITAAIKQFRDDREWAQFHDAKNLAISLSIEASELLEVFLWKTEEEVNINKVKDELADVFYAALLLADKYDLDVRTIVLNKLKANELKYPATQFKSSNKKYDEL